MNAETYCRFCQSSGHDVTQCPEIDPDQLATELEARRTAAARVDPIKAQTLALAFARELQTMLSADEWREMCEINASNTDQNAWCASHDYCDANEVMAYAMSGIDASICPLSDEGTALWNLAWSLAMPYLSGKELPREPYAERSDET